MTKRVMSLSDWVCVQCGRLCLVTGVDHSGLCKRAGSLSCVSITCGVCPKKNSFWRQCVVRGTHNTQATQRLHTHAAHGDTHTHTRARQEKAHGLGGGGTTDEVVFWASGSLLLRWRVLRGLLRRLCRRPGAGQAGIRRTGGTSSTVGAPTRGAQAAASKLMRIETGGLSLGSRRAGTRGAVLKQGGRHFQQPSPLV